MPNVTMADIAESLGVSIVTVSKALSGKSGVSEELREKIIAEAERVGYSRNEKRKSGTKRITVGVIVAERFLRESRSFYWRLYQEIAGAAGKERIITMLEVVTDAEERETVNPELLRRDRASILIVMGTFSNAYLKMLQEKVNMPLLSVDSRYEEIDGDAVILDNIAGGLKMTNYLISHGHEKIGFVGTLNVTPSIDSRFVGYRMAMLLAQKPVEHSWMIKDRDPESAFVDVEGTFQLPEREQMPTAFFCNSDFSAQILIRKLRRAGYLVPEDISVTGFDHYLPEGEEELPLTTYEVRLPQVAHQVVELAVQRIADPDRIPYALMIRGDLVEGQSVADRN